MKLALRTNGIHSLVEALTAFKKFHDKPDDPNVAFTLKDTILRSHHALEVLFKNALLQYNSVLLLEKDDKIGEFVENYQKFLNGDLETELDDVRTISLKETIDRLRKLGLLKIDERDYALFYDAIEKLDRYRNRLQHFELSADPDVIARMLGIVLPRAIDILDTIPPHHPILGNIRTEEPILKILERDFPDAISTVQLLRSNYDSLIDQAVAFFKKKIFSGERLELLIEDYGTGFWGPPQLKGKGFLNFQTERLPPAVLNEASVFGIIDYSASTRISNPEYTGMSVFPFQGKLKGSIDFHAEIKFRKAEKFLVLPESEEKIAFLRDLSLTIDANLQYEAEGMKGGAHFDINVVAGKKQASKGNLTILLTAIPRGYEGEKPKVVGKFETTLNEESAPFNVHCFLEPDGSLRDQNRHLEWKLNTIGDVIFD
jgi:hypothetical protein